MARPQEKDVMVSIIFVNYNTKELTKNCIDSIVRHTQDVRYEIIVVDNASTDGSREAFRADGRVTLIESNENLGFGRANNLGMKHARGDYFFLLNTDTLLLNNALKYFLDYEKSCAKPAVLGGWLLTADGERTRSYGIFPSIRSLAGSAIEVYTSHIPAIRHLFPPFQETYSPSPKEVDFVCGADMFFPRSIYDATGGFDPDFFMYYEETEWQYRMSRQDIPRILISEPRIIHYEGGGKTLTDCGVERKVRFLSLTYSSMFKYIRKTRSYPSYAFFRILFCALRIPPILLRRDKWKQKKAYLSLLFQ